MMDDRDVCFICFSANRPHLFPFRSLKVYEYIDPHPVDGELFCGHHIEMMCEDCAVVHWAVEWKGPERVGGGLGD